MPGGNIKDPLDNATAGLKYLIKHWTDTGGDPTATAMRYHGGDKGDSRPNVKDGLGVSNKRYGDEVMARLRRNQPDERVKNDARMAAIKERAKKLGIEIK
jgi:soluble lytic murein transglycosylase-like protein